MLQTERPVASNHTGSGAFGNARADHWIKLGKNLDNSTKLDIIELLLIAPIPEEFNYKADFKYLYYKDNKLVGLIAYRLGNTGKDKVPMLIHMVGDPSFTHSMKAYKFMLDTFKDIKKDYNTIVANIPNERHYMIDFAVRFGFVEYSKTEDSKFYYLDLNKIRS